MNVLKLKKLVSKLNKEDRIVGVWKLTKSELMHELSKIRYMIDDENLRLIPTVSMKRKKAINK